VARRIHQKITRAEYHVVRVLVLGMGGMRKGFHHSQMMIDDLAFAGEESHAAFSRLKFPGHGGPPVLGDREHLENIDHRVLSYDNHNNFFPIRKSIMNTIKMNMFTPGKILALLALAVAFAGIASLSVQSTDAPEISHDGLYLDPDSDVALLYVKPDADFSVYNQFLMLEAYVAFKKNWQRNTKVAGRRVSNRDMEKIKVEAAELLRESFKKELDEVGGYEFVEKPGDSVLIMRPALIDLEITAPDIPVAGRVTQYVASAGAATIFIELYDSVSGEILARAIDRRRMGNYGVARWASSVSNRADAARMFKRWASLLRQGMDEVRTEAGLEPIKGA
jgi:hypothetical protein